MPTTFKLLFQLIVLGSIGAGVVYALATYVEPTPETVSVRIPSERFTQ
ncbi:MAG: hypothetical protein AAF590_08735 [Pseudomonadota bacterium]